MVFNSAMAGSPVCKTFSCYLRKTEFSKASGEPIILIKYYPGAIRLLGKDFIQIDPDRCEGNFLDRADIRVRREKSAMIIDGFIEDKTVYKVVPFQADSLVTTTKTLIRANEDDFYTLYCSMLNP
jgi:hypothetical protein